MVISQGDVWWADLPEPVGSRAGYPRPVVVVQGDRFNRSAIDTVVCVPLTTNLRLGGLPGNVLLSARLTGLPKASVANVSLILSFDKELLTERTGKIPEDKLELVLSGIDVVLGR